MPECQTPVCLIVESVQGRVRIHVDVGEEAPTVKGLISILVAAFDRQPVQALAEIPAVLLSRLGLQDVIRMNRAMGFSAMIGRHKSYVQNAKKEAN